MMRMPRNSSVREIRISFFTLSAKSAASRDEIGSAQSLAAFTLALAGAFSSNRLV